MPGVFSLNNTLSGMNANTLQQAAQDQLFQQREQQINAMPPPQPMDVPDKPNFLLSLLPLIAASFGDALTQRPGAVEGVADIFGKRMAAPKEAMKANEEMIGKFKEDRAKLLHELSMKRLDAQVELLKQQGKDKEAARVALDAHNMKKDYEQFERTLPPSEETKYKESQANYRAGLKGGGEGGGGGVDGEKPITLKDFVKGESEINRKFPSKLVENDEGKKELAEDPQLYGSKLDFYVAAMQSKSPGVAQTAARKMGRLVKTTTKITDPMEFGQKLIDLGITDRSVWDAAMKAGGFTNEQIRLYLSKAKPQ